jgi:glycosyltransferase involved in cell wall biosynthesis
VKHIVLWLGPSLEPWEHKTALDKGIGGSELAAIRLAQGLAERGFRVTVYADISDPHMVSDVNPRWLDYHTAKWDKDIIPCDLLISSRCPSIGLAAKPRKAANRPTWLWMHDLHVGADWGNHIGETFDQIVCLTRFASQRFLDYYPRVDPSKVIVIPNGTSPSLYKTTDYEFGQQHRDLEAKTVPLTLLWSSAPDRGLDRVLDLWPYLLKMYPNAELRIFGNIFTWAERAEAYGKPEQISQARRLLARLRGGADGVRIMGKVGQAVLGQSWIRSHLWLYPTSFEETSCITAMEAQMSGVKIACTPVGALPETAPLATFLPVWSPSSIWRDGALDAISKLLADEDLDKLRDARDGQRCWLSVILQWRDAIKQALQSESEE